jgi:hypothetical protein
MVSSSRLEGLTEELLNKNLKCHRNALEKLSEYGDDRIIPHLIEIAQLDAISNHWDEFGHPEILRDAQKPYTLNHPEVRWPGVIETLRSLAEPEFDSKIAWLRWETWYTQQDIEPLPNYVEWKIQLYRLYHPLAGHILDTEPRIDEETFQYVRGGIADPSTLHPLNIPTFRPSNSDEYIADDDIVYGFSLENTYYAVPRWMILPHEGMNMTLNDIPVSLSYCPLCDAPILFEREIENYSLTLGCSGFLLHGNKIMYDDETGSLWSQQLGEPIAGRALEEGWTLDTRPISQVQWADWKERHPDTQVLDRETGYDWDYEWYQNYDGHMKRHYWDRDDILLPGLEKNETTLGDTDLIFGISTEDDHLFAYSIETVHAEEPIIDEISDRSVVILKDGRGAVAYEAPPEPVGRDENSVIDSRNTRWKITRQKLVSDGQTRDRVPGHEGMWWSFRPKYDNVTIY